MAETYLRDIIANIINKYDPKKLDETIFTENVLTRLLNAKGLIKSTQGFFNAAIEKSFIAKKPDNIKAFDGDVTLDFMRDDYYRTLTFNAKSIIGTMYFSERDLKAFEANQGDLKIRQTVQSKLDLLFKSISEEIERQLWADGTGSGGKELDGLKYYLPSATTDGRYTAGTIGGLARADYEILQHYTAYTATPDTELVTKMSQVFRNISSAQGIDEPDMIIMSPEVYDKYEDLADNEARTNRSEGTAELSWVRCTFKGKPVVYANALEGEGLVYMLNSKYVEFQKASEAWMDVQEHIPYNQRGKGYSVLCAGNLIIWNLKRQGVLKVEGL